MAGGKIHVSFASDSGHQGGRDRRPLSAITGREQVRKNFSIRLPDQHWLAAPGIFSEMLGRGGEYRFGRGAVGAQIEHFGMLAALTRAKDGDRPTHQLAPVSITVSAGTSVKCQ